MFEQVLEILVWEDEKIFVISVLDTVIETLRLHDADSNGNAETTNKLGARTSSRRTLPAF